MTHLKRTSLKATFKRSDQKNDSSAVFLGIFFFVFMASLSCWKKNTVIE